MKYYYNLLVFLVFISFSAKGQSVELNSSLEISDDQTVISLVFNQGKEQSLVYEFNYIPSYRKRLDIFSNGSIVGFLPVKNTDLTIKRWNDFNHEFILFFWNSKTGDLTILKKANGWSFHILDSSDLKSKWIAITSQEELSLFLFEENGRKSNQVSFLTTFDPDVIVIDKINEDYAELSLGILGREAIYGIDFINKTAHMINEFKTDEH